MTPKRDLPKMALTNEQLSEQLGRMVGAITKRLDEIDSNQKKTEDDVAAVLIQLEALKEVARIVRGVNGSDGLVIRMDRLQNSINMHTHTEATRDVRVALYGDESHEGLVHSVEELKKWKDSLNRWGWFLATTAIVSILNLVITLMFYFYGIR